jgi:hypothetical protein
MPRYIPDHECYDMDQPDHREGPGRPKTNRVKFTTTLRPDTRNQLITGAHEMGANINAYIEHLVRNEEWAQEIINRHLESFYKPSKVKELRERGL